ncbi:MAG: hypothetical protein DMF05_12555 [Verrucomicrobia bacterium]|nr:MAG: hypothetical protein DMF05_12555 [Verrucomicrobiota bacterium]
MTTFPVEAVLVWGAHAPNAFIRAISKNLRSQKVRDGKGTHRRHARRMCSPDTFASPREQIGLTRLANPLYPPLSLACEGRFLQNAIERRPKPYCACASTATQGWAR